MIDPYGNYKAERDRRTKQVIYQDAEFDCLYCMDLKVVWEPLMQDAPINQYNPRREQPCPMCKKGAPE